MSAPKGYPSGSKLDRASSQFSTVEPVRLDQYGLSVIAHQYLTLVATKTVGSATTSVITSNSHGAQKGDVLQFTSGAAINVEVKVLSVTVNTITLCENLVTAPSAADTFTINRHKYPSVDSAGNVLAALSFIRNSAPQSIIEDTGTPANNRPLPVELLDSSGNVNTLFAKQSGTWNITNISGTISLPTGAATEATLAAQSAKLPATLGQHAMAASMSVAVASDQSAIPVSQSGTWNLTNISGTISLPTGAATEVTLAAQSAKLPATLGQHAMAASMSVAIASDQSAVPASQSGTWNITNISGTITLPTGAATGTKQDTGNTSLSSIDGKTPALGQALAAASVPVVLTASQLTTLTPLATVAATQSGTWTVQPGNTANTTAWLTKISGKAFANAPARNDYSSVNVTTAAYVQLVASTTSAANEIEIFDSSGQTLALAVGAAASEVIQCYIFPGGNGRVPLAIPASSRVSIKAISATASAGEIDINFYT